MEKYTGRGILLFTVVILLLAFLFPYEPKPVNLDDGSFATTSEARLFFNNTRTFYYTFKELDEAGFTVYNFGGTDKTNSKPCINFFIVQNWRDSEAYIMSKPSDSFTNQFAIEGEAFEYLREVAHLRVRTNTFGAVARVRHCLSMAVHRFFHENGFFWVHTPIITANDCEGAGEMFRVSTLDALNPKTDEKGSVDYGEDFFGKQAHLTVSGQLNVETYCMAMSKVYTFGPTFRAENSNTTRHLDSHYGLSRSCQTPEQGRIPAASPGCSLGSKSPKRCNRSVEGLSRFDFGKEPMGENPTRRSSMYGR